MISPSGFSAAKAVAQFNTMPRAAASLQPSGTGSTAAARHRHVLREGSRAGSDDVRAERQRTLHVRADPHDLAGGLEARHIGGA
ncbi:hypothetical protein GCM10020000_74570 [Streptomyces olivoverticillatus]